jgi:hypothetical protein
MPLPFQMMLVGVLLAYLWQCQRSMQRRNMQNPQSLIARLRGYPINFALDDRSTIADRVAEIAGLLRQHPRDSKILWTFFRCAGIALELIDCAERNIVPGDHSIDLAQLTSMRTDAMQIRVSALTSLVKCAFPWLTA